MPREFVCGTPGCTNKGTVYLPKDLELRQEWYRVLNLSHDSNSHRICRAHFRDTDFTITGKRIRPNVIPSRNLPQSFSSVSQDLELAVSTEVTIGLVADPVPDSLHIPIPTNPALPEHDYSVSSVPSFSSLLQTVAKLRHENSELKLENSVHETEIQALSAQTRFLKQENSDLKSKLKVQKVENKALARSVKHLRIGLKNCQEGKKLSKKNKMAVCKDLLGHKLSDGQLDILASKKPRQKSRKWTNKDYSRSQKLSLMVNKKAYQFIQQEIAPQPGFSTARKKFSHVKVVPGKIIKASIFHIKHLIQSGKGHLLMISFDEFNLTNRAEYDMRMDCVVGKIFLSILHWAKILNLSRNI